MSNPVSNKFRPIKRFLKRVVGAVKIGYLYFKKDSPWDYQSIYSILEFKLSELLKNYYHTDKKLVKATRIASKLSRRLQSDDFYNRWFTRHECKWGKATYWTTPVDYRGETMYRFSSSRPKAIFEKEKVQERVEYMTGATLGEVIKDRDNRLLFSILAKYINGMWD